MQVIRACFSCEGVVYDEVCVSDTPSVFSYATSESTRIERIEKLKNTFINEIYQERSTFKNLLDDQHELLLSYVMEHPCQEVKEGYLGRYLKDAPEVDFSVHSNSLCRINEYFNGKKIDIEFRYAEQANKINIYMVDTITQWSDNDILSVEKDIRSYFLKNFSLFSTSAMTREARCFCLSAIKCLLHGCFMDYIKQEKKLWEALIHSRFCSLYRYRRRYFEVAMISLKRAIRKKVYDPASIKEYLQECRNSLTMLLKKDSDLLLSSLDHDNNLVAAHSDSNIRKMNEYMCECPHYSEIYSTYSQVYDYFMQFFAIPRKIYDRLSLANHEIAFSYMEGFVIEQLLNMRKDDMSMGIGYRCYSSNDLSKSSRLNFSEAPF